MKSPHCVNAVYPMMGDLKLLHFPKSTNVTNGCDVNKRIGFERTFDLSIHTALRSFGLSPKCHNRRALVYVTRLSDRIIPMVRVFVEAR